MFFFLLTLFRNGSCVPFSPNLLGTDIPCESDYDSGTDYVYIQDRESFQALSIIWRIQDEFKEDSFCMNSTIKMICHHYLPPCGNSTHFEPPTAVCSDACLLQSHMCRTNWSHFESQLSEISNPLNCSHLENAPLCWSDQEVSISKFSTQHNILIERNCNNIPLHIQQTFS